MNKSLMLLAALLLMVLGDDTSAQEYPVRPLSVVVPYPPGGTTDAMARLLLDRMKSSLGQAIVIENVGGAAGTVGMSRVARAAPDGYTIALGNSETHVFAPVTMSIPYDPAMDFEPVALLPSFPFLIASTNAVPARDLKGLVAWVQGNADKVSQGTVGVGTTTHLCGIRMQRSIGAKWTIVPYRGGAPAMQDLISGAVNLMCSASGSFLPLVRNGQIRAYAVTAKSRLDAAPEIPTVDEAGLPGLHVSIWNALYVPKRTPGAIIAKLNAAAVEAMNDTVIRKRVMELGLDSPPPDQRTPEALGALLKTDTEKWSPIIKESGLRVE